VILLVLRELETQMHGKCSLMNDNIKNIMIKLRGYLRNRLNTKFIQIWVFH